MNYTKGPWTLMWGTLPNFDGSDIITVYGGCVKIGETSDIVAAIVDKNHCEPHDIANASLISAAADMYEALKAMLGKAYKQNWNDQYPDQVALAEAALAKAEGK